MPRPTSDAPPIGLRARLVERLAVLALDGLALGVALLVVFSPDLLLGSDETPAAWKIATFFGVGLVIAFAQVARMGWWPRSWWLDRETQELVRATMVGELDRHPARAVVDVRVRRRWSGAVWLEAELRDGSTLALGDPTWRRAQVVELAGRLRPAEAS